MALPIAPSPRLMLVRAELPDNAGASVGSGTLVGPKLVLTAAHVVFKDDGSPLETVRTGPPEAPRLHEARVIWPTFYMAGPGPGDHDAALLEILDADWEPPRLGPARLGRIAGRSHGVTCSATGFPRVLRDPDGTRDSDQVAGMIYPASRRVAGRYDIHVTSVIPILPTDPRAPSVWSGMSGAGVFAGGLLVGVVIIDEPEFPSNRLSALPIRRIIDETGFRNAFIRHLGDASHVELASVELHRAFLPTPARRRGRLSPATLLRADAEVVPFHGRKQELADLGTWCDQPDEFSARLIVGPGGQGKTRLAHELIHQRTRSGWTAGFVASDPPGQPLDFGSVADAADPVLLVIDYAETRTDQISRLIGVLQAAEDNAPVRLLLLARSAGDWWEQLRRRCPDPLGAAAVLALPTLDDSLAARAESFDRAVDSFALALSDFGQDTDWADIAESIVIPDDIDADRYGAPLTLQMSALLALLQSTSGTAIDGTSSAPLEQQILDHEQLYWEETASDHGLDLHPITLGTSVAAVAFLGASVRAEASSTLSRVPGLRDQPEDRMVAVDSWLRDLYPAGPGEYWGILQPDRVAEYHVVLQDARVPGLLEELLTGATEEQTIRALALLARARVHQPQITARLRDLLTQRRSHLEPVAVALAATSQEVVYEKATS